MKIRSLSAAAALFFVAACGRHEPQAPPPDAGRIAAPLATAERLALPQRTEVAGTVVAEKVTAVSSRVMAVVTAVPVELGETVAAGATLVVIDPTSAQGQLGSAQGALAQARAALSLAERNLQRFTALAQTQAASELELDLARTQYEQAQGAVAQAEGAVAAAASVARESRVVAPFAARVSARMVEVGDLATPGRPLLQLESLAGRRVQVSVPEGLVGASKLIVGSLVPVRLDAFPDRGELAGRVVETSPGPDPLTHSYTVKVAIEDAAVPSGAAARVVLATGERPTVVVPERSLIHHGGLTLVVVRDASGRAWSRVVTTGEKLAGGRVEVLSGLAGGETLLLDLAAAPPAGALVEEVPS
ncbi:MAG TPA: efflux RND transporter periplasmic adaptor subunit [Thermoanaerobaculia bacterium]|nr:efflux RND transporter periplasmic adaptor subunit [Thermoanaerobaculia bacterium]